MIDKHKNFMLAIFYVVPPYFEFLNKRQKLTIVSFGSRLGQNYYLQIVSYWV